MKDHFVSKEMIVRAQQLRIELEYTLQDIANEAEKIGMPVAMATVKRFFSKDAVNHKFAVDTVQGIFSVLGQTQDKTNGMITPDQVDFLKDIIAFDRKLIAELDAKIVSIKAQHQEELIKTVTENQKRIDYIKTTVEDFKKQIEVKDRRMDERDSFFMAQIGVKDRRYDALLEKFDQLNEKYNELLAQGAKKA